MSRAASRRSPPRLAALAAGLGLVVGCAQPTTWSRADTPPFETQNDIERCWSEANAAVPEPLIPFQQQPSFGLVPTQNGTAHTSAIVVPNPGPSGADVSVQQRRTQLVDQCMRRRGYRPTNAALAPPA